MLDLKQNLLHSNIKCYLCGAAKLQEISSFIGNKSITTDGKVLPIASQNTQCTNCGLMQKLQSADKLFLHLSYSDTYELYDRPGMEQFDKELYHQYAKWVASYLPDTSHRILEVGCGSGWILNTLQQLHPNKQFEGIEPSSTACKMAMDNGVKVTLGQLGNGELLLEREIFDMAFSVNVIEHTVDPVKFIQELTQLVKPGGLILTICPNSDVASTESLYIDHLFSIRKDNLHDIFKKAGVSPQSWETGTLGGMGDLQLLSGTVDPSVKTPHLFSCPDDLIRQRIDYMNCWNSLERKLQERLRKADEIICFGAGETSDMLAFYAPEIWNKVKGHVIDRLNQINKPNTYKELPLYYLDELDKNSIILLGTKPHYQSKLMERLSTKFPLVVRWDDLIT
jgi:SAM-dependent methyltransferase